MTHKIGEFPEDNFEQKLLALKDTQESIQSLSAWCMKYQQQHKKVVSCWLHVLKKVKVEQRVTLFYLANDVVQYSKRKNYPFVESWATALQKATPLVRDDRVKHKILRLFKIWGERNIYDEVFLSDLSGLLKTHTKRNSVSTADLVHDFQPTLLFAKIRKCKLLEEDTDLKLKHAKQSNVPVFDDLDTLQIAVKDRQNGDDILTDIDDGILKLEAYTKALELEIKERADVINFLEVGEQFYDTQRGEAKVVCNAYRNFGHRIKTLKRKLEEILPTLPSPLPSPDVDAPSPSSGSDIDIPDEAKSVCYDSEKSFIGIASASTMNVTSDKGRDYTRNIEQNYMNHDVSNIQYNMQQVLQCDYDTYKDMNAVAPGYYKNISLAETENPLFFSERHLNSDPYAYHSEGNPIEVINSSQNDIAFMCGDGSSDSVNTFLQNLTSNPPPNIVNPSPQSKIPGLESPTENAREVFNFMESKVKQDVIEPWIDKPVTKYQSWPSPDLTWNHTQETPVSPPAFEQESYSTPVVEYVDTNVESTRFPQPPLPCSEQNDMHPVATIPLPKHDVDDRLSLQGCVGNRNLIALTDSPSVNDLWKRIDSDYRCIPMPPAPPIPFPSNETCVPRGTKSAVDNIESVDMEMSDDEESKHDDKPRHRKTLFKDDEENRKRGVDHIQTQLMPPPNPWGMVHLLEVEDEGLSSDGRKSNSSNFISESQEPPLPGFSRFPMPPKQNGNVRFNRPSLLSLPPPGPPPGTPADVSEPMRPNFRQPFNNYFPCGDSNASQPVFGVSISINESSTKNTISGSYSNANRPPYLQPPYKDKGDSYNNIQSLIKDRQSFESFENHANGIPNNVKGPSRTNLKEISLSDVLEKSLLEGGSNEADNEDKSMEGRGRIFTDNDDLFGEETNNDNSGDDGDDLYNIEEVAYQPLEGEETKADSSTPEVKQNNVQRLRTPFQGTVPKAPKLPIAPANVTDGDDRSPWPFMPVIDLSDDNTDSPKEQFEKNEMLAGPSVSRRGSAGGDLRPWFERGNNHRFNSPSNDRRFSGPMIQTPSRRADFSNRRGSFHTPRSEFRPRAGFEGRQSRPIFSRSPMVGGSRGNFQNFTGRPQRPFRRCWPCYKLIVKTT